MRNQSRGSSVYIRQVRPVIILTSAVNASLAHRLTAGPIAAVDKRLINRFTLNTGRTLPMVQPSDMLYLVFTSNSTGEPNGIVAPMQISQARSSTSEDALGSAAKHASSISHPIYSTSYGATCSRDLRLELTSVFRATTTDPVI